MSRAVFEAFMIFGTVAPRLFEPLRVLMLGFAGYTLMAAAVPTPVRPLIGMRPTRSYPALVITPARA